LYGVSSLKDARECLKVFSIVRTDLPGVRRERKLVFTDHELKLVQRVYYQPIILTVIVVNEVHVLRLLNADTVLRLIQFNFTHGTDLFH
jgi:hypothetical protein